MARNDAVKKSESEYITFIDSDDWIYPEYLSMLYSNAIKYSADICTVLVSRDNVPDVSDGTVTVYNGREAIEVYARFDDERFRSSVAKLIRRSFVLNIPFPTDRTYSEDMAIVYQWLFSAEIVVGVDYSLYFYFTNNESVSTQPYGLHRLGDLKTWNEMLAFFKEKGFDELHASKQPQYANALYTQYEQLLAINETEIASKVKRELKRICKNSKLSNYKNQPHIYNCLYPKRMKIYWTLQGILGGFKCRK